MLDFAAVSMTPEAALVLTFGIMFCSILCAFAALRNQGEVLEKTVLLLACQAYIILTALLHLATSPATIPSQVMGMVTVALGVAPIILKKNTFQGARYCVALGALLAAVTMLLF